MSEVSDEDESRSGTMPEAVTTRGIWRLSRPNEDGSPEASSRRLEYDLDTISGAAKKREIGRGVLYRKQRKRFFLIVISWITRVRKKSIQKKEWMRISLGKPRKESNQNRSRTNN